MFDQFNLNERLLKSLAKLTFSTPTAIQQKVIPTAMQGKDVFVTAPTGTGKTIAFVLPLLHRLLELAKPGTGLQALIVLPTRELATQIYKAVQQLASYTFFEPLLVTGGEGLQEQAAKLRKNPDIVIGTPGRLVEHWKKQQFSLDSLKILVLDETDRILDMGFGEDVNTLIANCPITKQTLLFSATKGDDKLQLLINSLLISPAEIHLGDNKVNSNITQQMIFADNTAHKERLTEWLLAHETYQKVIIFTNTRHQADQLSNTLTATQIKHAVLHSEKTAEERKQTINRLNQQHISILIATDVAARGLDIEGIDLVINFELPNTTDEYIHRVGRTGRMHKQGLAISLISLSDWKAFIKLEKNLNHNLTKREVKPLTSKFQGFDTPQQTSKAAKSKPIKETPKPTKKTKPIVKTKDKTSSIVSTDGFAPLKKKK